MNSEGSSYSIPYALPTEGGFVNLLPNPVFATCENYLSLNSALFSNNHADIVVFSGVECLEVVTGFISQRTSASYVGLVTADAARTTKSIVTRKLMATSTSVEQSSSSVGVTQGVAYITSDMLLALLIMIPLIYLFAFAAIQARGNFQVLTLCVCQFFLYL